MMLKFTCKRGDADSITYMQAAIVGLNEHE